MWSLTKIGHLKRREKVLTNKVKQKRTEKTLYEKVGGHEFFARLVEGFYDRVEGDPVLRPLYPKREDGMQAARDHLAMFLSQYWGGPPVYNETRGAPMLRARHLPFRIGVSERDAWFGHMKAAVEESGVSDEIETELLDYFDKAATHLINDHNLSIVPSPAVR